LSVAHEPERESRSHARPQLDDSGVDGALRVLGGCARAHPPDVAPELVCELETRSRAFMCDCSRCSLGMLCQGSRGRCGKCGCSSGHGHFGRHDRRDRSIMTARRRCRSVFRGDRGVTRVGGCSVRARARVGESSADTAGPASKVRGRGCLFKTARRARVQDFAFPLSSSSRARIPLSVLFRIRSATASCAPSPPETPPPRCRTGCAPTCLASSSSVLEAG
jgi:hypothetical protein